MRIEISHRDTLLTFFGRPYLPTFSPVIMMMNNISWRTAECVSHGKSPGLLRFLTMSSFFLCMTLFSERGGEEGQVRKGKARKIITTTAHTCLGNTQVQDTPLPPQTPQNIFISIIKQFSYMLIHQSGRGLIFRHRGGWCAPLPLFRCATLLSRHLSRCVAHKAPALSALIDQRPAVKEGSSIPYQWCSTSAPEKSPHLLPQHAQ